MNSAFINKLKHVIVNGNRKGFYVCCRVIGSRSFTHAHCKVTMYTHNDDMYIDINGN